MVAREGILYSSMMHVGSSWALRSVASPLREVWQLSIDVEADHLAAEYSVVQTAQCLDLPLWSNLALVPW